MSKQGAWMDENFVKGMGTKYVVSGDGQGALDRLQLRNKLIGKISSHILRIKAPV
jgi:hypothetical protein